MSLHETNGIIKMKHCILIWVVLAMISCWDRQATTQTAQTDTTFYKSNNPLDSVWINALNKINLPKSIKQDSLINVYFKYDTIIDDYEITGRWMPFESTGCETGYLVMNFRNTISGQSFQYIEEEKYNNFNTDRVTFSEGFTGYQNGDVYYFSYISPDYPDHYKEYNNNSPIGYYSPFQFIDVDFDGEKELLINDWGQYQGGNHYYVYKIDKDTIRLMDKSPYNSINNLTQFDIQKKRIIPAS